MLAYLALAAGLLCAAGGGEFFVRGTIGIAAAARVTPAIIAATVAAFATSSPELTVAISSSLAGEPAISFGDALGSNVANIALILGAALLFGPLAAPREGVVRDYVVALATPLLLAALVSDGRLSRADAGILMASFALWLAAVVRDARRVRSAAGGDAPPARETLRAVLEALLGLVLLVAAGKLIVFGAEEIARTFGASEFLIGATVVAVGTSTPELATAIMSRLRGQDEIGLGALLGSNIFNGLFIVGVASAISPFSLDPMDVVPALLFGLVALAAAWPTRDGRIGRSRGVALLAVYLAYLLASVALQ